jgi:spermidine/putrescine ABC transporter ATP-binding subunit
MPPPILELINLRKDYGRLRSVDDISVRLAQGEFMSLLGPSGSGKTTTLNMIAGLIQPTAGEILLQSRSIVSLPSYRRNIGVVFQNYALFPHMTVGANIAFPLQMRRVTKAEIGRRVKQALDLVQLERLIDRLPHQLSGGQQQRVALARAMVFEPPLLLMDEPLGALDKQLREQMQIEIKHLHERLGISVIYVTHDQDEALTMSDRIAVFNHGRIEQLGTPAELYNEPVTRFVAGFVGETNLIAGQVTAVSEHTCQVAARTLQLTARHAGDVRSGQNVTLAVRPERLRVVAHTTASNHTLNEIPGTIAEVIYLGRAVKYVVDIDGLSLSVVQQIDRHNKPTHMPSDNVCVSWDPDSATVLAGE